MEGVTPFLCHIWSHVKEGIPYRGTVYIAYSTCQYKHMSTLKPCLLHRFYIGVKAKYEVEVFTHVKFTSYFLIGEKLTTQGYMQHIKIGVFSLLAYIRDFMFALAQ